MLILLQNWSTVQTNQGPTSKGKPGSLSENASWHLCNTWRFPSASWPNQDRKTKLWLWHIFYVASVIGWDWFRCPREWNNGNKENPTSSQRWVYPMYLPRVVGSASEHPNIVDGVRGGEYLTAQYGECVCNRKGEKCGLSVFPSPSSVFAIRSLASGSTITQVSLVDWPVRLP